MLGFGGFRVSLHNPCDPPLLVVPHVLERSACVGAAECDLLIPQLVEGQMRHVGAHLAGRHLDLLKAGCKAGHGYS